MQQKFLTHSKESGDTSAPRSRLGKMGLIWKVFIVLFIFLTTVMGTYAYISNKALEERLERETQLIRAKTQTYFSNSIENHINDIQESISMLSGFENSKLNTFVSFFERQWDTLALDWEGKSVGIYKGSELVFEKGHQTVREQPPFADSFTESSQKGFPDYYFICQQECSIVIIIPVLVSGEEIIVVVETSLLNPILRFREFTQLKTLVISQKDPNETITKVHSSELQDKYLIMRPENNQVQLNVLKRAVEQYPLDHIYASGGNVNLGNRNYLIDIILFPHQKASKSYLVIMYDITHKRQLDSAYYRWFSTVSIISIISLAFIIFAVLWQPINRIKKLKNYLPTLAHEGDIRPLDLEEQKITFYDEINALEKTSNNLAMRLMQLNNVVIEREGQLKELAHYDSLTGLANRVNFYQSLNKSINTLKNKQGFLAVLFLDLDRFKHINDSLGHDVGDQVLKVTSKRLLASIRDTDLVSRIGGDEFTIVLTNIHWKSDVVRVVNTILTKFTDPIHVNNERIDLTLSIGITLIDSPYADMSNIIRQADIAMYCAKRNKLSSYEFFSTEMQSEMSEQFNIINDFNNALEQEHFVLYFQPIMYAGTSTIRGFETLIRWEHESRGLLTPDKFLPTLRETKQFRKLEERIIYQGILSCKQINQVSEREIMVSINLTAEMFMSSHLCEDIRLLLKKFNVSGHLIRIEIVEDTLLDDIELASQRCHELASLGINVSIDDFGVGYSSLSYLTQLPADNIKIDRSFVTQFLAADGDSKILLSLIDFLKDMNKSVTVEGIETQVQVDKVTDFGCDFIQGYFYSKPVPLTHAIKLLEGNFADAEFSPLQLSFPLNESFQ
ncbi:bifunctional diguanylate cyclase/phosphodiesterase [Vibrio hannami]|uniref:putative bifunctional diguanylate cyclase/phosphodiesterase n=1 Tax=Vibrio hannami TaxID=2717094 RepID=UPI0024104250|nr:bifunctional diguanylate cyclase/phosphodiesterase [Vibrio hannami]MDG3087097.1 bifunctional diguanylate cyclase/phosphodiesterase [Vibrio hannami]